ncbi:UNVERIFIED_CONTAM: hypothetical protein GTU68_028119 [Idotea baltica]|nr:hypothetical protein [Idotea baltica]
MNFADKLNQKIKENNSCLLAGFDPRLDLIPNCIIEVAEKKSKDNQELTYNTLVDFYELSLKTLSKSIAAVKPNIAFFEALGETGLKAFETICKLIKEHDLPLIIDAKRGDIGSTAKAYSKAFLSKDFYDADALTVNPYLGFDTIEPYLEECKEFNKGIFILVKTSNPGSGLIQNSITGSGKTVSQELATWVFENGQNFTGDSGLSSIGAVVGATYPEQATELRKIMKNNFFLIPGLGAQGGTGQDAVAGFNNAGQGAIVNASRGIFSSFPSLDISLEQVKSELKENVSKFNQELNSALKEKQK